MSKGCDQLLKLLNTDWWTSEDGHACGRIAEHIRTCPQCIHGMVRLSHVLIAQDHLSCDQCRNRFPDYYEAIHPEYSLVDMRLLEIAEVALHLGGCAVCSEEYEEFVLLSLQEEQDEI